MAHNTKKLTQKECLIVERLAINRKDMEIINLRLQNEQLRNKLKSENKLLERMNKPSEATKYFE